MANRAGGKAMVERATANDTRANRETFKWKWAVVWGGALGALVLPILMLYESGFPSSVVASKAYFGKLIEHVAHEILLTFAGALIAELWAVKRVIDSTRPALESLKAELPLITKMTESSFLAKAAGPLIEQSAGIDDFAKKQQELACCLLDHSAARMQVILQSDNWRTGAVLFQEVRENISNLASGADKPPNRVVSAYLMSLINPAEWSEDRWEKYQESLWEARVRAKANGPHVDFKRIHVLQRPETSETDVWKNLVSLMIAEAIMGFQVQAMLLEQSDVEYVINDLKVGYKVDGAHLYDCGVYQGVKTRFVVVADSDPYFMSPRKAVNSALVSHDVGLLDILRRNFNTAWRSTRSKSLFHLLKLSYPSGISHVSAKNIADFVAPKILSTALAPLLKVLANMDSYHKKDEFWIAFKQATDGIVS